MYAMRTLLVLMTSLLFGIGHVVEAAEIPFSLHKLREISAGIVTLRIPFNQTKRLAMFDEPVITSGLIEINRTLAAVRWEYTGKSVLVLYRDRIRRWDASGNEETLGDRDPSRKAAQGQMQAFLTGDWSALEDLFMIKADDSGKPVLRLDAKSADIGKFVSQITIEFRPDLSAPARLTLTSADNDVTEYEFGEPHLGVELPEARFLTP
jgi:hypothetical protein